MTIPNFSNVLVAVPFFKKEKLTNEQSVLQKQIDQETTDLKKIAFSRWTIYKTGFKKAKIFSFCESTLVMANNQLHHLKTSFEHDVASLRATRFKLMNYVLPNEKTKQLQVIEERSLQAEITKNKLQSTENHQIIVDGTKAETDIDNAMIVSLASKSALKKAEHLSTAIDNAGLEIELNAGYKNKLLHKATDESIALIKDESIEKPVSALPTYPERNIEEKPKLVFENYFTKEQPKLADNDIQKTVFKGGNRSVDRQNFDFTQQIGPEYYLLEKQFFESQQAYGNYWADSNFPDTVIEDSVCLSTKIIKELDAPHITETFLGSITKFKVNLTYFIVFIAMIPEFLIYSKIISAIFEFDGIKVFLCGSIVILLSKCNAILIYGSVLEFFKKQSQVFRIKNVKSNRFFLGLFCVSLLYCFCIGLLFKDYKDEQKQTKAYVMLQQKTVQLQEESSLEENPNGNLNQKKLAQAQLEADKAKEKLFASDDKTDYLKVFTIGFSGAIVLLFSSCLFAMALIFSTAYHLRRKVETLSKQIATHESRFNAQKDMMHVFRTKAFQIYCKIGELEFLRRLVEGMPKDALFHPPGNNIPQENTPLPLTSNNQENQL